MILTIRVKLFHTPNYLHTKPIAMKYSKIGACSMMLFVVCHLNGQTANRPTISSGGGYFILNGNTHFQSTLGEAVIQTIQSGNVLLSQGFQQVEQIIDIPVDMLNEVVVYPNPAADQVKIRFTLNAPAQISFALVNNAGQIMRKIDQSFAAGIQEVPFDFKVAPGLYLLTLSFEDRVVTTKVIIE